jgi:hypothetical protein
VLFIAPSGLSTQDFQRHNRWIGLHKAHISFVASVRVQEAPTSRMEIVGTSSYHSERVSASGLARCLQ